MKQIQAEIINYNAYPTMEKAACQSAPRYERFGLSSTGFSFFLLLLVNCYAPILLLWSGAIPFAYRFHVLAVVLLSFILHSVYRGYCFRDLGFTWENSWNSIRWNLLFCAVGGIGLYLTYRTGLLMPREYSYSLACFLFYILILGPVQELIFRGIMFAEMKRCRIIDPKMMLLISTITFSFLHIIYNHPPLLLITFVSGLVWGMIYLRWPSIWGISFSHSLLGALAMFLGVL
ncbi:MAG: CPBP family intramembrane metalloprotease [Desulfobulbaceae bacterium]|nr:CPBP family intramembrane metalloprotease [Desulfobulbaceae bacterium]